jgi:hypothetical protein
MNRQAPFKTGFVLAVSLALGISASACGSVTSKSSQPATSQPSAATSPRDIEVDDVKAADLQTIQRAVDRGDTTALVKLAIAYGYGIGVKVDADKYMRYMAKAAKAGNPQAQDTFGQLLLMRSPTLAIEWFKRASDQDYSPASYDLGLAYLIGRGIKKNEAKGCELFLKSARQGNDEGEYSIGTCYYDGVGLGRNSAQAFEWYKKAAAQDFPLAEQGLGVMYGTGDPMQRDLTESLKWMLLANGGPENEVDHGKLGHAIALLKQQMTSQAIATAQQAVEDFRRTHKRHKRGSQIDYGGNLKP